MKHLSPEVIDRLANEYALGTLHGQARKRFEKLAAAHPSVKQRVSYWQNQYAQLATRIDPVQPRNKIWKKIESSISYRRRGSSNLWLGLWATVASALLVFTLVTLPGQVEETQTESQVAFIGESAQPQWIIQLDLKGGTLTTTAINASAIAIDKTFELWSLPENANPQSLGLLPVNGLERTVTLNASLLSLLQQNDGVAVSVEPLGGSPTGLPTGEVVYTGAFYRL